MRLRKLLSLGFIALFPLLAAGLVQGVRGGAPAVARSVPALPASQAAGDPEKGKAVFESTCSFCHVADSDEVLLGPGLKNLFHWPPHKLSDGTEHTSHTEEIIRKQIVDGGGAMQPAGGDLSEEDLANLIAYLKTL